DRRLSSLDCQIPWRGSDGKVPRGRRRRRWGWGWRRRWGRWCRLLHSEIHSAGEIAAIKLDGYYRGAMVALTKVEINIQYVAGIFECLRSIQPHLHSHYRFCGCCYQIDRRADGCADLRRADGN